MRPLLAAALLVPLAATACARGGRRGAAAAPVQATLEVRSEYIGTLDVFAIRDNGFRQRIASQVSGTRVQRFRLSANVIGGAGTLRIVAVPIGGGGLASTGVLTVRPGDVVQFNISSNLAASSVFVR